MDPEDTNANKYTASKDESAMVGLLRQIFDILQTSTIAEERGKDVCSKFWAAYKKVSGEYDDDMLERCNGNMDIVLIFAGLFSAANTAFIIAMQPNPVDTTNILLVQLIQITLNGPSAAQPMMISSSTGYSSSEIWTQALAYASLAFSLVAAFGAVLGKQWLGYYKTRRYGRGSLEARCKQRHRKFLGLKSWRFEDVLQLFPVLLQMSLFLFGLSLGAGMWTQQHTISIFIIAITACGALCHACTIMVSLKSPDCPFQSPVSLAIRAIWHRFRPSAGHQQDDCTASAMQWILESSTNPDVVMSAVDLMLTNPGWPNIESLCEVVGDKFKACFDLNGFVMHRDSALAYGTKLIKISWNNSKASGQLREITQEWRYWNWASWCNLYLPWALEQCHISFCRMKEAGNGDPRYRADTRTALCMALAADFHSFPRSYHKVWSWDGKFRLELNPQEVDWIMACAEQFLAFQDFDAAGYALCLLSVVLKKSSFLSQTRITPFLNSSHQSPILHHSVLHAAYRALDHKGNSPCNPYFSDAVLRAICPTNDLQFMHAIELLNFTEWPEDSDLADSPLSDIQRMVLLVLPAPSLDCAKYIPYCRALIDYMGPDKCNDSRRVALRRACNIRQGLALITADAADVPSQETDLSKFSPALLTVDWLNGDDIFCYLRLVFALSSHPNWHPRLDEHGHVARCIQKIPDIWDQDHPPSYSFYLSAFFLRIQLTHPERPAPQLSAITSKQWWDLTRMAWHVAGGASDQQYPLYDQNNYNYDQYNHNYDSDVLDDGIEILEALIAATKMHIPQHASRSELEFLCEGLGSTLSRLKWRVVDESILAAVRDLKDVVDLRLNAEG